MIDLVCLLMIYVGMELDSGLLVNDCCCCLIYRQ